MVCVDLVIWCLFRNTHVEKCEQFGGRYKIFGYPLSVSSFISVTESRHWVTEIFAWILVNFIVVLMCPCWKTWKHLDFDWWVCRLWRKHCICLYKFWVMCQVYEVVWILGLFFHWTLCFYELPSELWNFYCRKKLSEWYFTIFMLPKKKNILEIMLVCLCIENESFIWGCIFRDSSYLLVLPGI